MVPLHDSAAQARNKFRVYTISAYLWSLEQPLSVFCRGAHSTGARHNWYLRVGLLVATIVALQLWDIANSCHFPTLNCQLGVFHQFSLRVGCHSRTSILSMDNMGT